MSIRARGEIMAKDTIVFVTAGGTIDKIYFDANSQFEVGDSQLDHILEDARVTFDYRIEQLMRKDSLEMDADDRTRIRDFIESDSATKFVVTHGTDTLTTTAEALLGIKGKTIVLTGALSPARFRSSDATFNVGLAIGAVQSFDNGVYVALSGRVFVAGNVVKNLAKQRFEEIVYD